MIELSAEATEWCVWLAGICWAFGWSVVRHSLTKMAWAAAVRHLSGLLWTLSGAVGWMITKPLWCVDLHPALPDLRRLREDCGKDSAVRRWKLYEALCQTPMVVLED
ncbi:hypothetical protein PInf_024553 [Phytophthora infestans]|nr:hypothetical protein PInf_024553 [Phytophthora infestans]